MTKRIANLQHSGGVTVAVSWQYLSSPLVVKSTLLYLHCTVTHCTVHIFLLVTVRNGLSKGQISIVLYIHYTVDTYCIMPSIASFIKELLSEDQYSDEYNKRIQDRIEVMNAAQLQGKGLW